MARKDRGTPFNGAYLGLDPAAFALANYHCSSCNTAFSSNDGIVMMCPTCGKVAKKQKGKVKASAVEAFKISTCKTCASELHSDLEPEEVVEVKEFTCPECGDNVTADDEMEEEGEKMEEVEVLDDLDEVDEEEDLEEEDEVSADGDEDDESEEDESEDESDEDESEDESDEDESDEESEEGSDDESEDESEEEESEAMATEIKAILDSPLRDREAFSMDVWHVDDDTVRNVIIAGMPVARIHLSDQEDPVGLQDVFTEDMYADALAESMIARPVGEILLESNARIIKGMKESGVIPRAKEVEASVTEKINAFRSRFKETFLTVLAGANKNLFPDVINSLKNGLWEAMAAEGVESPENIIEPAFEENADEFVDQVFDKTLDLMEKGEDVRKEIMTMVNESGVRPVQAGVSNMDPVLAKKLTENSFPLNMGKVGADTRVDLRNKIQLAKRH